jgi:Cupin-like domain
MQLIFGLAMKKVELASIWVDLALNMLTQDHYENLYCQIVGCKIFYLIPPTEYPCLKGAFMENVS